MYLTLIFYSLTFSIELIIHLQPFIKSIILCRIHQKGSIEHELSTFLVFWRQFEMELKLVCNL
jgi:hypothetical protein